MRLANSVSSLLTVFLHRKLFPGVILLNKLPHVHPLVKSLSTKYFPTTPLVGTFSFQQGKKNFDLRPWDFINYEDIQNSFCFNSILSLNQQKSQNSNTNNIKRNQGATWGHHESRSCIIGVSEQYDSGKKKKRKLRGDCPVINLKNFQKLIPYTSISKWKACIVWNTCRKRTIFSVKLAWKISLYH